MRKSLSVVLVLLLAVSLLASCGGKKAEGKVELRLRLQEGKAYSTRMVADQTITQTAQGQEIKVTQTIGMGYTFDVKKVESDGATLVQVTYDSALYKQDSPAGKVEYDSANPPAQVPDAAIGFAALVGQGFSMKLSALGEVLDVQGTDELIQHMLDQLGLPAGEARDSVETSLKTQFGTEGMKETMEKAMAVYPEKPVGVGDSWTKKMTLTAGVPIIVDNTWTVKSIQNGVISLDVRSKVEPNPDAAPMEISGMTIAYKVSGTQTGTMTIDQATGWTQSGKMTQDLSGDVTVAGSSWPITIKSDIRFEPVKK